MSNRFPAHRKDKNLRLRGEAYGTLGLPDISAKNQYSALVET